jgi:hypothetical protein
MTRYLILVRSVFGLSGRRIAVVETDEKIKQGRLLVTIPGPPLDAYGEEKAGVIDLLRGQFNLGQDRLEVVIDDKALAEFEDPSLERFSAQGSIGADQPP